MSALLQRLSRAFQAKAHTQVDALEQPEPMLNQLQRELTHAIAKAGTALVQARAWHRQLQERDEALTRESAAAERAAARAIECNDDAMARAAVERKLGRDTEREALAGQLLRAEQAVQAQRERTRQLTNELSTLKEKRIALIQRARFARSVKQLGCEWNDGPESISAVVARLEEKVLTEEAAADALLGTINNAIDTPQTAKLDDFMHQHEINDELKRIRQRAHVVTESQPATEPGLATEQEKS